MDQVRVLVSHKIRHDMNIVLSPSYPPHLWSKSPPSFSYNDSCIDLDHPHLSGPNLRPHSPITIHASIWTTQPHWHVWSKTLPSFSYNDTCINLDHPHIGHLTWSKSPSSFSYNDRCNDLDHPHFDPQSGPNLRSHFPITIQVTIWTISAMTSLTCLPPAFIFCNNTYIRMLHSLPPCMIQYPSCCLLWFPGTHLCNLFLINVPCLWSNWCTEAFWWV